MKMPSPSGELGLSGVLERIARHLDALAGQIYGVEDTLSSALAVVPDKEISSLTRLQSLDYVRQSLEDCALLVHLIRQCPTTEGFSTGNALAITQKLKLDSTRAILGPAYNQNRENLGPEVGDLDLF